MSASVDQPVLSDKTRLIGFKLIPIRGRRFKVVCYGQSGRRVGRRYKLTTKQLACLTCAYIELAKLDDALALIGIWREASTHREPEAFTERVLAEIESVKQAHGLGRSDENGSRR